MVKEKFLTWETYPKVFFAYLAGIILLTVGSSYYQCKHNQDYDKQAMRSKY